MISSVRCASCGARYSAESPEVTCVACGGLLELELPDPDVRGAELAARFSRRATVDGRTSSVDRSGVWRFRDLVLPEVTDDAVTYPEGNTPLIGHPAISRWAGVESLHLKHEGMNPTGSFKDRGMCVAITQAKRIGAAGVMSASTGNTSSSMAAYAALAGIRAAVLVPSGAVASAKLAQTSAYGASVIGIRGDFDACLRLARDAASSLGYYLVNSINPFRVNGQKTIVLEMLEQLGWDPPDWIALPAGNLGNASAFGAALRDAVAFGLIARVPRLLLVQAAGAAPFARAFEEGFAHPVQVRPETVATAIRIGDPASYERAVRVVRETNGLVIDVSDEEILAAKRAVDGGGVGCEPASAASVAGVRKLVERGTIGRDARIVCVLTGHLLKDVDILVGGGARGVEIDATVAELGRALGSRP